MDVDMQIKDEGPLEEEKRSSDAAGRDRGDRKERDRDRDYDRDKDRDRDRDRDRERDPRDRRDKDRRDSGSFNYLSDSADAN